MVLDEQGMQDYGRRLGRLLGPGSILALIGDLGVGKTFLTAAVAEGLGVTEPVISPTFTIIREYESGRIPLYHFDVYRIDDPGEMDALGCDEYFYGGGLTVVEWADKIAESLPPQTIVVEIGYGEKETERIVRGPRLDACKERDARARKDRG
ncbi:MAG: tRNA (adenosine(37)-N6)-threonylcarbamoyltransferase complex ATPase subunit type 1 TsaE [Clostridiales Family XIII bacterium]|jgi:tRNA threonylcarbamoyladenosine biosynthesis protein TsaE|nr:tRNA (adenosine(37)-N6)-threonylcarbamoyltransferase complex ATPase subunit type 1 TsaE [Clostridiales Family XIII bacterium]